MWKQELPDNYAELKARDEFYLAHGWQIVQRASEKVGKYGTMYSKGYSLLDEDQAQLFYMVLREREDKKVG